MKTYITSIATLLLMLPLSILAESSINKPNVNVQGTSEEEAYQIATSFFASDDAAIGTRAMTSDNSGISHPSVTLVHTEPCETTGHTAFYLFNRTDKVGGGFVIVSASAEGQILGYCDNTAFDYHTAPDGMKSLLYMLANNNVNCEASAYTLTADLPTSVEPLLKSQWDQLAPYNQMCPTNGKDYAVVGCGATCISQIAYYYKYPVTGTGSNSYVSSTNKYECSYDFGKAVFDYANMIDNYSKDYTTQQKYAVAELMYAAGVAVNMDYKMYPRSSTCTLNNIAVGLSNYFNYDAGMAVCRRDYYTIDGWKEMLCTEISEGRPVVYQGIGQKLGHVFLLDGYNSNRLFHVNWGWGGTYDGYYDVGNLSVGNYGALDTYLWVIRGIEPAKQGSVQSNEMYAGDLGKVNQKSIRNRPLKYDVTGIVAQNYENSTMDFGSMVVDKDGVVVETKKTGTQLTGRSELGNVSISYYPNNLECGCYRLYPAGKQSKGDDWKAMRFWGGADKYIQLDVRVDSTYSYTGDKPLSANDITYTVSKAEDAPFFAISCEIVNDGKEAYSNNVRAELWSVDNKANVARINVKIGVEAYGKTTAQFTSSSTFANGEYFVFVIDAQGRTIGMKKMYLESPIPSGIDELHSKSSKPAIYRLDGRSVLHGEEHGIVIKRSANGEVRKELVK